ncbi:phosphatase PAP2/dual specificity phosphatase family protein [Methylobrevis albus]|uniref:Phosphatase PAP2/dual specificity phosphatase family protein n=1 Tax=Methylobrevis albus TaxID=2793297 RepID=A0A931I065_9HYPH|nr:phosphatase PAP2/dual specificity phosphatase family protein [Methylobrevis albus]MBH0236924.1 phosphatase PAP2/dual specificity phosphatase family protein [Methylobrevis albus]
MASAPGGRPFARAAAWLAVLAPFFYLSYGAANWLAAQRMGVPVVVFGWERHIPFIAWTIIPYWSVNLFYGASLFVARTRAELDTHGRRLLTAQVIAVACFLVAPLRFSFEKPDTGGGLPGFLFDALAGFDKPFNQAPSLHIALLVILWVLYARHLPRWLRPLLHVWFALIGVSVLTTYQHHFIDVPTGALLGLACLWIWPDAAPSPFAAAALTSDPRRHVLALRYLAGAALFAALGLALGGAGLWLFWPAVALGLVAANYAYFGPAGFQKRADGRMSLAARLLLAPYILAAFANSRLWTRRAPRPVAVSDGVYIGRFPARSDRSPVWQQPFVAIVDLAAELPAVRGAPVVAVPALDLVMPPPRLLRDAAIAIERVRAAGRGPVLVCCALGFSRSAAAAATWLVRTGRVADAHAAVKLLAAAGARVVLCDDTLIAVEEAARLP